jgi:rhodanese-related sulfurtransferase
MENSFGSHGFRAGGLLHLTPAEALEMCSKDAVILDVREDYMAAFKQFKVAQVLYIPLSELNEKMQVLPADRPIIVADATGLRSREAAELLTRAGFTNIANLAGGIVEWERDGLPLITDTNERLSGGCMCQLKPRERKKE